jgi:hypothetical protein
VGISKLAFEYCHEMVEGDTALRDDFFGTGFQWTQVPAVAFDDPAKLDMIPSRSSPRCCGTEIRPRSSRDKRTPQWPRPSWIS